MEPPVARGEGDAAALFFIKRRELRFEPNHAGTAMVRRKRRHTKWGSLRHA